MTCHGIVTIGQISLRAYALMSDGELGRLAGGHQGSRRGFLMGVRLYTRWQQGGERKIYHRC